MIQTIKAKDEEDYLKFKKELEDTLECIETIKKSTKDRINYYENDYMIKQCVDYKEERLKEENELLTSLERNYEFYTDILRRLTY